MKCSLHSDKRRYGMLVANTQNDFVMGIDKYPTTVNKAYDMLVNFVNPNKAHGNNDQDSGMSFYQDASRQKAGDNSDEKKYIGRKKRRVDEIWGGRNHRRADNHATAKGNEEENDKVSANNSSTNNEVYSDASLSIYNVEQIVLLHTLPQMWLLIDSCLTTDIFGNASLLTDLHKVSTLIWV